MSVVSCTYQPSKATGSGAFRESHRLSETWMVRVDAPPPTTSVMAILTAPAVGYGTPHFTMPSLKAMQWSYAAADSAGMLWAVTIEYYVPIVDVDPTTGLPMDVWTAKGATVNLPFFRDKDGNVLKNSAGDPLEGMERELCFLGWSLVRSYVSLAAALSAVKAVNNRTNSDTWPTTSAFGLADTWKCSVTGMTKKVIVTQSGATQTAARYWEVAYDIDYREETWHCKPWDMGFSQRVNSSGVPSGTGTNRATILGVEGRPVKQPVALSNGVALSPGTPPVALDFDPYSKAVFATVFGEPS